MLDHDIAPDKAAVPIKYVSKTSPPHAACLLPEGHERIVARLNRASGRVTRWRSHASTDIICAYDARLRDYINPPPVRGTMVAGAAMTPANPPIHPLLPHMLPRRRRASLPIPWRTIWVAS